MPRGGARVGAGRPKKTGGKPAKAPTTPTAGSRAEDQAQPAKVQTPLEFMLEVMNNPKAEDARRDRMAVAAAPFCHMKKGEGGKKDERADAAKKASTGKYAPSAPPKLVAVRK